MWSGVHMVKSLSTLYPFYTEVALYSYTLNTGEDIGTRSSGLKQKKETFSYLIFSQNNQPGHNNVHNIS